MMQPRTLVISDPHGEPSRLAAAMEHADFRPGTDRIVVAGDAIDRGGDSVGCYRAILDAGGTLLCGNHEACHVFGILQAPYDFDFDVELECLRGLGSGLADGTHPLAVALAPDLLVSHAGLSELFFNYLVARRLLSGSEDAFGIAEVLNGLLRGMTGAYDGEGGRRLVYSSAAERLLNSDDGPLFYRPFQAGDHDVPLRSLRQVVGHSPHRILAGLLTPKQNERLSSLGFVSVDSSERNDSVTYALVSGSGSVSIREAPAAGPAYLPMKPTA